METKITRRPFLAAAVGTICAIPGTKAMGAADPKPSTGLGLVIYCRKIKRDQLKTASTPVDLYHPTEFFRECRRGGAGGMQAELGKLSDGEAGTLREESQSAGMYVEAIIRPPRADSDIPRFEHDVRIARMAGAEVARTTIISGRRYERFTSLDEFRQFERMGEQAVRRAIPVLERHKLRLAIENHKDQRNEERLRLLERLQSEYVGACVDTGNSFALLEDPIDTIKAFAPWAMSVHLKDQGLKRIPSGYLLADVPLGQGALDLGAMVEILKTSRPGIRFSLELITRDALVVPCLTDEYFGPFGDLPARDLARTILFVETNESRVLPSVSDLSSEEQLMREDANISASLQYASRHLRI